MARQLIIHVWCDACAAADEPAHTVGEEFDVAVNGGGARTIALCPEHVESIMAPLARLLNDAPVVGAKPEAITPGGYKQSGKVQARAEAAGSPFVCPFGDGYRVQSRAALGHHLRENHDTDVISARMQFPEWSATLPGRTQMNPNSPGYRRRDCPERGCNFHTMTGQGLAVHLQAKHGLDATARKKAYAKADAASKAAAAAVGA